MEKRIVTITTTDKFFKDDDCEFVSERPEKVEEKYIYDLKESKEKEVKYIVKRAYTGRIGSIIVDKPINFSKDKTYLIISEIIFWEQIPENKSPREEFVFYE